MFSIKNSVNQFVSKVLTHLIGLLFIDAKLHNFRKGSKVEIPDTFVPVIRFAVCSDIHLDGDENQKNAIRLREMFDDLYSYSESSNTHKSLDAVLVAGDFTGKGDAAEYEIFKKIINNSKRDKTELLCVLGNHEFIKYRDKDASVGYDIYKKFINEEIDIHKVINGYHFIGVSYDIDGKKFTDKIAWLKKQLEEARKDNPDKPIFVFQHPHPFATVYGSINWGDTAIRKALNKFPEVIDFSGHSHYAPSDPRSVWQGRFTAVGCGSLSAFMGNLNYIAGDKDAHGKSGGYWVVEADYKGNVKMGLFDAENRRFFDNIVYYFSNISDVTSRNYTWHKQKSLDTKPYFPKNSHISSEQDADGNTIISFPDASGYYEAENYKITIKSSENKLVFCDTVISDYVRSGHTGVKINIGKHKKGNFKFQIDAFSPYACRGGRLKGSFSIK